MSRVLPLLLNSILTATTVSNLRWLTQYSRNHTYQIHNLMVPSAEVKIKEKDGILKILYLFLELFAMRANPEQKRIQEQRKITKRDKNWAWIFSLLSKSFLVLLMSRLIAPFVDTLNFLVAFTACQEPQLLSHNAPSL